MNKTIYLPDDEAETWEKARRLANDKLSPVILDAIKKFVASKEAENAGLKRIEVKFEDSDDHNIPKIKAFRGQWIISPKDPLRVKYEDEDKAALYCVAIGAKGSVVVYHWHEDQGFYDYRHKFNVYPSFEEAAADHEVNYAVRQAMEKRGVPVEELDI